MILISLLSCNSYKDLPLSTFDNLKAPPGTAQVSDDLFFDRSEGTNFHWL